MKFKMFAKCLSAIKPRGTAKLLGSRQRGPPSNDIDFNPTNVEAFIKQVRQQAVTTPLVECDEGMTFDLLLNMCHDLVTTNREIWERCKPFCCKSFKSSGDSTDKCIFYRVRHMNAKMYHPQTTVYGSGDSNLILESQPHVTKLAFEIPISLPAELECFVGSPKPEHDDFMPSYGLILQRSMLLIDEVVPTFLLGFKAFLENQQVALGRVDVWLFHENELQLFLNDHFGVTINYDDPTWHKLFDDVSVGTACETDSKCQRCGDGFYRHKKNEMEDWRNCETDNRPGCFPLKYKGVERLLHCTFPGTITFNVSIETPDEQSRLVHVLKFVGHNKTTPTKS